MFSSAELQDFFEKLLESSTETAPSRGSFMKKRAIEQRLHIFIAHKYGSCRFRRSKVWELSIEALNPHFQVQNSRTFPEIDRELHRNSTFKRKLYGKSAIEKRLRYFLLYSLIARRVKTEARLPFQCLFF